jgi:opacity protein-like surface antigen
MQMLVRRLAALALGGLLLLTLAPSAAAGSDLTAAQAESEVLRQINGYRASLGLIALRLDTRIRSIARYRSNDMVAHDYFGHVNSDGRMAWDIVDDAGVAWYRVGEIIASNNWPTLRDSAAAAIRGWKASRTHDAIMKSAEYNYVGVGLATTSDGWRYWTAVFLRGPDRTPAVGRMGSTSLTGSGSTRTATIRWSGSDPRLQALTAGLASHDVSWRVNGGRWTSLASRTTATSLKRSLTRGNRYDIRIRSRDRAGNLGAWSAAITLRP